jgi:hypothetical protein
MKPGPLSRLCVRFAQQAYFNRFKLRDASRGTHLHASHLLAEEVADSLRLSLEPIMTLLAILQVQAKAAF